MRLAARSRATAAQLASVAPRAAAAGGTRLGWLIKRRWPRCQQAARSAPWGMPSSQAAPASRAQRARPARPAPEPAAAPPAHLHAVPCVDDLHIGAVAGQVAVPEARPLALQHRLARDGRAGDVDGRLHAARAAPLAALGLLGLHPVVPGEPVVPVVLWRAGLQARGQPTGRAESRAGLADCWLAGLS